MSQMKMEHKKWNAGKILLSPKGEIVNIGGKDELIITTDSKNRYLPSLVTMEAAILADNAIYNMIQSFKGK
ncbi:hypothetical protein ACWO80_003465 [Vibrio cholerae]